MRDMLLGRMKTLIESMIKERLRIKVQWLRKGYRLRVIQENFEEGYVKAKKSGNEGECLSILRGAKEVSMEERHNKCQK